MSNPIAQSSTTQATANLISGTPLNDPLKAQKPPLHQTAAIEKDNKDIFPTSLWTRISEVASSIVKAVGRFFKYIGSLFSKTNQEYPQDPTPGFPGFFAASSRKIYEDEHAPHSSIVDGMNWVTSWWSREPSLLEKLYPDSSAISVLSVFF